MEQPDSLDFECDTANESMDCGEKSNMRILLLMMSMVVSANKFPKGKQKDSKDKISMMKEASFSRNNNSKQVMQTITESLKIWKMRNLSIIKQA